MKHYNFNKIFHFFGYNKILFTKEMRDARCEKIYLKKYICILFIKIIDYKMKLSIFVKIIIFHYKL